MTKEEFKQLVKVMVDEYGVRSYLNNDEEDDLWFECPECGEPILFEDYADSPLLSEFICPICQWNFEGTMYYGEDF